MRSNLAYLFDSSSLFFDNCFVNNWDEYSSIAIDDTVTHWMPLPEPPKMKGGAE